MEKVNIVFTTDSKFYWIIPTVVNSILQSNKNCEFDFTILYTNSHNDLEYKQFCANVAEIISLETYNISLYEEDISTRQYNGLAHVSSATMIRLFIERILFNKIGRVLYLDLDLIVNTDLGWVNKIEVGETGICAKNSIINNVMAGWLGKADSNLHYPHRYSFNAGVMVMDLEILRSKNFTERVLNFWKENPECNDQIILNFYCDGKYNPLPERYNLYNYQDDSHIKKYPNNFILHFVSSRKPWSTHNCKNRRLWKKYKVDKLT